MNYQPEIAVDTDGDALADAANCNHLISLSSRKRRVGRTQDENALQTYALKPLAKDARLKGSDVSRDVGQFRHCIQIAAAAGTRAMVSPSGLTQNGVVDQPRCADVCRYGEERAWLGGINRPQSRPVHQLNVVDAYCRLGGED